MPSLFCAPVKLPRRLRRRFSRKSSSDRGSNNTMNESNLSNMPTAPPEPNSLKSSLSTKDSPVLPPLQDTMPKPDILSKYSTLNKSATLNSNLSFEFNPDKSFWNIGGYKYVLNRCEDGHELGNKFIEMLTDRAKVEDNYAKSLLQWKEKWNEYINKQSTEYGTCKRAWGAVLETADEVADIHAEFSKKTMASPVYKVKQWLKEKYQKHIINFKQKKEFEEEFEEAQKPWLKSYEKVLKAKKEYYAAVRKARLTEQTSKLAESNPEKNNDQKRRAQMDAEIAGREKDRALRKYQDELSHLDLLKPRYIDNMTAVFNKTQEFEEIRMHTFKEAFLDFHSLWREQIKNPEYDNILQKFILKVNEINHKNDLNWWSEMRGAGMSPNWPSFEEYNS